jgi:hypothetical protein
LATDSDGYLPEGWEYDNRMRKQPEATSKKSTHSIAMLEESKDEDYDFEIEFDEVPMAVEDQRSASGPLRTCAGLRKKLLGNTFMR